MSTLADIYISRDEVAAKYDTEPELFKERAQFRRITPLELSILWSIMRSADWDVDMMDEFPCVLQINEGERLIHKIPTSMVSELATLSAHRVTAIASAWSSTEELNCSPEEIRPVVEALGRLAAQANENGQSMFLWNCV